MKLKQFDNIDDLNEFLTKALGLPPIPKESLEQAMAEAAAKADPDADEISIQFTGGAEADLEAEGENGRYISEEEFNSYVEFSSEQIARLVKERDSLKEVAEQAVAAANQEVDAHHACHEAFDEHIRLVRLQGYAESTAAGLYPGQPFADLPEDLQRRLIDAANTSIQKMDEIRSKTGRSVH